MKKKSESILHIGWMSATRKYKINLLKMWTLSTIKLFLFSKESITLQIEPMENKEILHFGYLDISQKM